jgi:tetratricopeptide (TPR) repeat protein
MENYGAAIQDYNHAIGIDAKNREAYFGLAASHAGQNNYQAVVTDYTTLLSMDPANADLLLYRGSAQIKLKHFSSAISDLNQAARLYLAKGNTTGYKQAQTLLKAARAHTK